VVIAVLAGIIQLQMFRTLPTKLSLVNLVRSSPLRRAFSFCNNLVIYSSINLGVLIDTRGGNWSLCILLILPSQPSHDGEIPMFQF
jgi:hypothetical protein